MTTPDEVDRLYREGVAAIRARDKATGKEKLMKVVEADQLHEQAWLWLSACVDTSEEQIICLQNVLTVNPQNEAARLGLEKLGALPPEDEVASEAPSSVPAGSVPPPAAEPSSPEASAQPAGPSPASELSPDEQWRARVIEKYNGDEGFVSEALLIPSREDLPPRGLSDLFSAWANALIFKRVGSYDEEVEYGSVPHILINIVSAVFLQMFAALVFGALLLAVGRNPNSLLPPVIESANEMLTTLSEVNAAGLIYPPLKPAFNYLVTIAGAGGPTPQISPEVAASFGTIFVAYLIVAVLTTFAGQMILAMAVNRAAEWLGGKGGIVQTTLALTIGLVATNIVQIPVWAILPFSPTTFVLGSLAANLYQFLQMANAIMAAHKMNILEAMGVILIAGILMGMVGGLFVCLIGLIMSL